jgi:ABC-2 type transport system permease protein
MRSPGELVTALVFPLILYGIMTEGLSAAGKIPGFPTTSFATFALTLAFAQGAMLTISNTGQGIATDVETGFVNRLSLTPIQNAAVLAAQLAGPMLLAVVQGVAYLGVGLAIGAHVEAGVLGAVVLILFFVTTALGFGAFGIFVGLRTGSSQAVQGIGPLMLVFLFLSSVNMPRNLITEDWFKWIATVNPVSYIVEAMRSLLVSGWDAEALALGFAVVGALIVLALLAASRAMQQRLVRT